MEPQIVIARMHEHLDPMNRAERYEDPLDTALEAADLGAVTGGGSQLNRDGMIDFVDVELEVSDVGPAVDLVVSTLQAAGAPVGSQILDGEAVLREFGTQQCLAVFLDGTSLPDEVYEDLDFDDLVGQIGALAGQDSYHGFWQGSEETGLFFFGPSAEEMLTRVEPLLHELPIGQNARVVLRHGNPGLQPRTVRIPRR